jgi:hypothetical protein
MLPQMPAMLRDSQRQERQLVADRVSNEASLAAYRVALEQSLQTASDKSDQMNAIFIAAITARQ